MRLPRPLLIGAATCCGLFVFLALTLLFIPDRELQGIAARLLAQEGYTLQAASFRKAFPLGIAVRGLTLASNEGKLLALDEATVRLRLLPLLTGRANLALTARIGTGRLTGETTLGRQPALRFQVSDLPLESIPFFTTRTGAQVKGLLRGRGEISGSGPASRGEIQLEAKGAEIRGVRIGEMPLPDASYPTIQGMLRIGGGKTILESFTLQGEGLFVRLKGELPITLPLAAAPLNLTLELMPKPEFLEKQKFVFLLLVKYLSSPGHYQVPIRGTLGKPLIQ